LLDLINADVLAISQQGEVAILLDRQRQGAWPRRGTLATVPLGGVAPRPIMTEVQDADWSRDGTNLAVVHIVSGRYRLEYPLGTVRYETDGWISHPRISPAGDEVAFIDHPIAGDDRGDICIIGQDGRKRTLWAGWASAFGLAWRPHTDEIWFTAAVTGSNTELHAVSLSGRQRTIARAPGQLTLEDILNDGRALVVESKSRVMMKLQVAGAERQRDLSLFETSVVTDVSADGSTILFTESGAEDRNAYPVYMQKLDGSPPVRLGNGFGASLSPDGRWAVAVTIASPPRIILIPTGTGDSRVLPGGGLTNVEAVSWLPDSRRIVLAGNEPGRGVRLYVQNVSYADPIPISPEGVRIAFASSPVSPQGDRVAAIDRDRRIVILPLFRQDVLRPIAEPGEIPIRWSADGRSLFVFREGELPGRVFKLDLDRNRKDPIADLRPEDLAGLRNLTSVVASADGRTFVYSYSQNLSDLYLATGLR
jgi:eukaryotic-like serine/threonine-protein kinase